MNPVTNKTYVVNFESNNVTVIDGSDHSTTTVAAGTRPFAVAVNPVTNKIYVSNVGSAAVTVIDGSAHSTITVAAGDDPVDVGVNPVTNKIYVVNNGSADVTVITPNRVQSSPLTTTIAPLSGNTAATAVTTFSFTAASAYTPIAPPVQQIYYQVDTQTGPWLRATPDGASASGDTPPLLPGVHLLFAFATDGQVASSIDAGASSSPILGQVSAYLFLVVQSPPLADAGPDQTVLVGDTVTLDGSRSSDVDRDPLTFSWSLTRPAGSGATLSDPTAVNPTFVADLPPAKVEGGAVAAPLVEAALGARALSPLDAATWRLLVGPNTPEAEFQDLAARAPAGFVVERARPDFRALLARARLSISQAGYNTVLEVLAAGIPAVVAPFAAGSETEQSLRAGLLAERGALTVVEEATLGPETLAAAVRAALARDTGGRAPGLAGLDTSGADKMARIVRERLAIVAPR